MCVILLYGVQDHITNTARVTPTQTYKTKQKYLISKAERKHVPAKTFLKLGKDRNLYLMPAILFKTVLST